MRFDKGKSDFWRHEYKIFMPSFTFYIETYGCKVNQYESQMLRETWRQAGGQETSDPGRADYVLVNSCAITARAERNARNALGRLKKAAPNAKTILTGCAAQFYADFTPRKNVQLAKPDFCINQQAKNLLLAGPQSLGAPSVCAPTQPLTGYARSRPVIKVQDGCSQNCAYCIVPQTRGKPCGRNAKDILTECRQLAGQGYGELVLSGINLRQYPGGFWPLLAFLDQELAPDFAGKTRLRISSLDPAMLNESAWEILATCKLLCPHLHLSLQHVSPRILALMGRKHYDGQIIREAVARLGQIWPTFGLGADILVGFPGETEEDLQILLDFVQELPLTYAHVFPYSRRPGTRAKDMPGQIAKKEKEERATIVREVIEAKKQAFLQRQTQLAKVHIVSEFAKSGSRKGINEFYGSCIFNNNEDAKGGIFVARPVGTQGNDLVVENLRIP